MGGQYRLTHARLQFCRRPGSVTTGQNQVQLIGFIRMACRCGRGHGRGHALACYYDSEHDRWILHLLQAIFVALRFWSALTNKWVNEPKAMVGILVC